MPSDKHAPETTVRVRVLVAIDHTGAWVSAGHSGDSDPKDWIMIDDLSEMMAYRWIEADVPVPVEVTVEGAARDVE
jgi:hypothetical protein